MSIPAFFFLLSLAFASPERVSPPAATGEIVVTASALPEQVDETPAAVTLITREDVEARAATDVAELLREVPGLVLSRSGSAGRATSLFTRGANSTHTLVLWNGIEITNPYFAGYDWARFTTTGVEQIEVVRGPYSALYGSDAVAGVVNVLTVPSRSGVRASFERGGNGWSNQSVAASAVRGRFTGAFSFESREDDGFDANDDFAQDALGVTLRWQSSDRFRVGVTARRTAYELGIPRNLDFSGSALVPSPERRQDGSERQLAIPIEGSAGRFAWDLTLAESQRNDDFTDPDDPYGNVSASTDSTTRRARLTIRSTTSFGTIVAGSEVERAEVDDITNFGPNLSGNQREERSFFIEDRYSHDLGDAGSFEVSAGVRHDEYETFGSQLSPRFSVAWVRPGVKLRAGYGHAFRAPSVGELYYPWMGNADLEAETSRSLEAGFDLRSKAGELSATLFRSNYDHLIVFDVASMRFGNIGEAEARGVELGATRELTSRLRTSLSYTLTETEEVGFERPLLRRPKHAGSLFLGYRLSRGEGAVTLRYAGSRDDVLPVAPFSRTTRDGHLTADANVQFNTGRFTPFVKIENLTDEDYQEVLGYPSPRRRVMVGVKLGL